ncbi:MAG: hypothetical protein UT32_C0010G0027 [Parcubacteria group bacterium GW2011_GWC2_39_14]|nr:MAG: hypothetical protein UT32_C0010G0027 [Parcubacteria group bacterium GW2011_GWC2_39_14]KKR55146.1 MAG: hypothetical protein UT91_C0004G0045 [Parcubacteria group bacterium GW2011_GWA2_40_23]
MPELELDLSIGSSITDNPMFLPGLGILFLIFLFIIILYIIRYFSLHRGRVAVSFQKKIMLITMPKAAPKEGGGTEPPAWQQVQEKIAVMETFFSTIAGLKAEKGIKTWFFGHRDVFSLEIVADKEGKINFFMAIPAHWQQYVEEQLQAQFPQAFLEEVPDYNIFSPTAVIGGRMFTFKREYIFPIKTFKKFDSDPLNGITNALSKMDIGDGAAIQIVIKSARGSWHDFGVKLASKMQQGKSLKDAMREVKGGIWGFISGIAKAAKPKSAEPQQQEQYKLSPMEEEVVKGLEEKASKAGVDANIRIVVSCERPEKTEMQLTSLVNAFAQYSIYQFGNGLQPEEPSLKKMIPDFIYRNFDSKRKMLFNTEELASLYHFPIPLINETPSIRWLDAKKAQAPLNVPKEGIILGKNLYRGRETLIRIKREDRRRHQYIIGMTGTGKSWYQEGLIMQDIVNGEGCCFIDPHGDAIQHILEHIPQERAEDVVILDPSDVRRPMGLNLLEYKTQEEKTFAINEIMAIFDKLYDLKATGGPMFEQYFKNAAALIMADPESGSTLLEISRVLADDDFRKYKLSMCKDQLVKDFWEKEAQKAGGEASLANMVPYITSKMSPFISNDFVRPIISQQNSTIDFKEIMNTKKILLVQLSKGKIGGINANLLGMLIIGKLLMAALGRSDMAEEDRKDFYLYVDEFQNFLTDSMEIILSEARKYRLCLTIGHQYVGQLVKGGDTKFKDAIFGNVGTKVVFRIGVDDAEALTKEFAPIFNEYDFLNVPKYNCYVKLLIDNANPPGFNMASIPFDKIPGVPPANKDLAEAIRELSRLKYGKDPDIIEMEVKERQQKILCKTAPPLAPNLPPAI